MSRRQPERTQICLIDQCRARLLAALLPLSPLGQLLGMVLRALLPPAEPITSHLWTLEEWLYPVSHSARVSTLPAAEDGFPLEVCWLCQTYTDCQLVEGIFDFSVDSSS